MELSAEAVAIGRLTKDEALFGYLAIDTQRWSFSRRAGLRSTRWSETRRRYRLDLLGDWDEGFLEPEDEADLQRGRFRFKGEALAYEELVGPERSAVLSQRFSDWT
ncbi:hypothetical protein BH23ACT12_BH23ACT12_02660 [soil metagenome]